VGVKNYLKQNMLRLPDTMWTLLLSGAFLDSPAKCANNLMEVSVPLAFVFILFVILAAFLLLNMLVGLLCEVVNAVTSVEKERITVAYVKCKLMGVLQSLDTDGNGTISKDEFNQMLNIPEAVQALTELGVDVPNLLSLSDHLFEAPDAFQKVGTCLTKNTGDSSPDSSGILVEESEQMTFADFLEMVIRLRSTNKPSVLDIVDLRKLILDSQKNVHKGIDALEGTGHELLSQIQNMQALAKRLSSQTCAAALAPLVHSQEHGPAPSGSSPRLQNLARKMPTATLLTAGRNCDSQRWKKTSIWL